MPSSSSPFEFVSEANLDFEHFKNRADFKAEFGGEGELYGRAEDAGTGSNRRSGTPPFVGSTMYNHSRTSSLPRYASPPPASMRGGGGQRPLPVSRDSERTFVSTGGGTAAGQDVRLLSAAAPIGGGGEPIGRATTPGEYRL